MKKSYDIGGRTVTLRSNVHVWLTYKAQFGAELPEDMQRAISLDEERQAAADEVRSAALLGEEVRLFLQVLWAFADEGTEGLPPFEDWAKTVGGVDIVSVVSTVTELYARTMRPDRRYRVSMDGGSGGDDTLTAEELADMIYGTGADSTALRDMTVGMAINLVRAHINAARRAKGEEVPDPEAQYRRLKEAVELIESGAVEYFDPEDYKRVKEKLRKWENG